MTTQHVVIRLTHIIGNITENVCLVTYSQYHNLLPHTQYGACLREIGNLFIQFVYLVEPSIYDCDKIFWSKQSSIVRDLR